MVAVRMALATSANLGTSRDPIASSCRARDSHALAAAGGVNREARRPMTKHKSRRVVYFTVPPFWVASS